MTWQEMISDEQKKEYYQKMIPMLKSEYSNYECYPLKENIFKAFNSIPSPEDVKVVILGQDPYHEPGQANGLAFSVNHGIKIPPSLVNIIKEIEFEFQDKYKGDGDLTYLAKQGVLLLNSTLTVRRGNANSHSSIGWQIFTDNMVKHIDSLNKPIVYMLWGNYAIKKRYLINNRLACILTAPHPSPLSANRGFFGCGHFISCNKYLEKYELPTINWLGGES